MKKTKKSDENTSAPRKLAVYSELNQTELHRSYGVKKKEGFFAHLNDHLATLLLIIMYFWCFVIIIIGSVAVVIMLGTIGIVLATVTIAVLAYRIGFRVTRKRRSFLRRLRRCCRKNKYKLKFYRGYFKATKFNTDGIDFTVDTGRELWSVRFLTYRKYNIDMIFEDEKTLTIKTNPVRMKASIMPSESEMPFMTGIAARMTLSGTMPKFFQRKKVLNFDYSFTDIEEMEGRECKRALVINPLPHTIKKKEEDGAVYETGSGERMWGYTIYSGSGFITELNR